MTVDETNPDPSTDQACQEGSRDTAIGRSNEDLIGLMQRREALLGSEIELEAAASEELDVVTQALRSAMSNQVPQIRPLSFDADRGLATRLGGLEAIHPLDDPGNPAELADRLGPDRRCFVLEHPGLSGHPLNVVWVALMADTPGAIAEVVGLARPRIDPSEAKVAVFYSIWNVEPGLVGIPGGAALLGLATERIAHEFPDIETYVTLSPIPGFRRWVTNDDTSSALGPRSGLPPESSRSDLLGACARYLTATDSDGRLIDSVARFHMRNGARLWRINWLGDISTRGLNRSWGLMANYRYSPEDREANKLALAQGRPALGAEVEEFLQESL